ncbi:DUF4393 domain-containing protein [Bacillus sp. JCM 19041]|uniref:DUF4393 domain-containing protein n=1 Tax=Bacillus sp. JCM 19041 TaxID=1460637 RepID=UPI0006D16A59
MTEINIFPKFIDKALSPVAESAGETLRSVWDIAFGGIDIYSQKKNLSRQKALESFKNDIDNKVSKIPLDKITEPELYIVGPTLEASKFYFENETLRELFANLIAASVNSDLHKRAHPSFVEIIKQLSSDEALMLKQMDNSPYPVLGIDFRKIGEQGIGKSTYIRDFNTLVYEVGSAHPDNGRAYLRNLDRLGLITIQEEVF